MSRQSAFRPSQTLAIYDGAALRVVNGANLGDSLSFADELMLEDIYRLSPVAALHPMALSGLARSPFRIAASSEIGTPGADLHLDCCLTFMSGHGGTAECLIFVETDAEGNVRQVYVHPLAPMQPKTDYVLVGIDRDGAMQRFAQIACTSFTRGTAITLATGAQKPVEALEPGDKVLTRDHGVQEIRWVGQHTVRATGAFAPIRIAQGTLNNTADLIVSPDFRLFIYQRHDALGAGRSELLVRARHLVNGKTITQEPGGFIDYFQMILDDHYIIYAEGIAAESMIVDDRTSAALPDDLNDALERLVPGHKRMDSSDLEIDEQFLARPDAAELLRRSSGG
ncbi:Hint domain-containing protein [Pacificoceanicola onchidii]|uniref:Hint domain-containing protein n=1 Tax=Pacificoceanicola onchidii TaxID=2562685 RepID=UPI0010A46039|nr:Hint domain-containing protein [Pacificoceanicola onchidii]